MVKPTVADECGRAQVELYTREYIHGIHKKEYRQIKVRKTAKIRNQYNQVPHLTHDTTCKSDKTTIRQHIQESIGQPFPSR